MDNIFKGGEIIKECSYSLDQNIYCRDYMEDFCKINLNFMEDKQKVLFTLHDGHNGDLVAKKSTEKFPILFQDSLNNNLFDVEESFKEAYAVLDEEFSNCLDVGSTSLVAHICVEEDQRLLYSANVGDSRSILIKQKEAKRLSKDHKAIDKEEYERVTKVGGIIFNNRLGGNLAITRSIGDFNYKMKESGLISEPYIKKVVVEDTDRFLIMGSDGIWDVINEEIAFELCNGVTSANTLAQIFIQKSINLGSRDNLSCIVVKLN